MYKLRSKVVLTGQLSAILNIQGYFQDGCHRLIEVPIISMISATDQSSFGQDTYLVSGILPPWLGGRMPDSGSREPGFESSTYDGAVDGDTLWRQQNKILVIVLGNKL